MCIPSFLRPQAWLRPRELKPCQLPESVSQSHLYRILKTIWDKEELPTIWDFVRLCSFICLEVMIKTLLFYFQEIIIGPYSLGKQLRKRAHFVGKYCCFGAPMGVPRVPDSQYIAPATFKVGWEKKRCLLQFQESITGPYALGKRLWKTCLFWG